MLLVEDEPAVRHMTSRALQEFGYGVVEASGGHQALGVIERSDGAIDLLITDVILPGMDGAELARRATELQPQLRVLFISGYTDEEIVRRGLAGGGPALPAEAIHARGAGESDRRGDETTRCGPARGTRVGLLPAIGALPARPPHSTRHSRSARLPHSCRRTSRSSG